MPLFVVVCLKKIAFLQVKKKKKVTQNEDFHFHVISRRMQNSIHLKLLHIAEETFLSETDNSSNIFYV